MQQPSATIIIPTFNRAKLLEKAIETSLNQTIDCEVIVVDHGSKDHTPDVVANFSKLVKYIRREDDFGPHFCWLEGVLHARSEFVHLQFDDDWIEPNFMEMCLNQFDDDTGFSFSAVNIIDVNSKKVISQQFEDWLPGTGNYAAKDLEKKVLSSLISPGCAIYRKQILLDSLYQGRLPLSNNQYHGVGPDCFVTLLSLLRYPKIGYVRERLATFLSHPQSITIESRTDPHKKQQIFTAYADVKNHYKELKFLKKIRKLKGLIKR